MDNYLVIILIIAIIATLYVYQDRIFGCKPRIITYDQIKKNKSDIEFPEEEEHFDIKSKMSIASGFSDMFSKGSNIDAESQISFNKDDNISIYSGLSNDDNNDKSESELSNNSPMSILEY